MKTPIITLEDALSLELGLLYDAEEKLSSRLSLLFAGLTDLSLRSIGEAYAESVQYKRLKIKRMFTYVSRESRNREDNIITSFLNEMEYIIKNTESDCIRHLLVTETLLRINQYKTQCYQAALSMALKLDWDVVADLLDEIIEWETKAHNELASVSKDIFHNKVIAA